MRLPVDDVTLDLLDEGTGPAIVLLHGFPLAKEIWDAQAAALSEGARVIRYDLRGLGKSSVPPGPYLMATLAGDLAAVLDALGVARAVVVGHSLGSYVAFAFFRMFAERVAGLGVVCGTASADDAERKRVRYELADRVERAGTPALRDAYLERLFAPQFRAERPAEVTRVLEIIEATDPAGAAGMLRGMAERDASDDLLEDIDCPAAVVAGNQDSFVGADASARLSEAMSFSKVTLLECGHLPQLEAPDSVTQALRDLLERSAP